jgi:hypothetical protein
MLYLELNQDAILSLKNGTKVQSGLLDALPIIVVSSFLTNRKDGVLLVNFGTETYYNLEAKDSNKQPIMTEYYYVQHSVISSLVDIDVSGIETLNIEKGIQSLIFNYLKSLPIILDNGDVTEDLLFADWTIKEIN